MFLSCRLHHHCSAPSGLCHRANTHIGCISDCPGTKAVRRCYPLHITAALRCISVCVQKKPTGESSPAGIPSRAPLLHQERGQCSARIRRDFDLRHAGSKDEARRLQRHGILATVAPVALDARPSRPEHDDVRCVLTFYRLQAVDGDAITRPREPQGGHAKGRASAAAPPARQRPAWGRGGATLRRRGIHRRTATGRRGEYRRGLLGREGRSPPPKIGARGVAPRRYRMTDALLGY